MIRIGVTQWSLDGRGAETVRRAAELGFAAIHLDAGELGGDLRLDDPALQAAYRQAAQATGVAITAIAPGYLNDYGLTSPAGSENAERCRRLIQIAVDAAAQLNVPLVFLPSFRASEIRDDADLRRTAEVLQETCAYAAAHGLLVATENTLGAADNLKLLEAVGRPNLRVLLDTQNPYLWGHHVAGLVERLRPHLSAQVHVKDGRQGQMGNALLGAGEAGFAETMRALQAGGFSGDLISENDYLGERQANAARDLAVLSELFQAAA
jgi:L-ribulose-5-phosphate 3-epimerase